MIWGLFHLSIIILIAHVNSVQGITRAKRSSEKCAKKFSVFPDHTACLQLSSDAVAFELSDEEKQRVLDLHNTLRANVRPKAINMLKMSWDDEVAMIAKKWTDSCQVYQNKRLHHDKNYRRFIPGRFSVGQNLASGYSTFDEAIDAWYAEESDYRYGTDYSAFQNVVVGHYTQLVWANSYKLGCSRTKCSGTMIYACNYSPSGNIVPFTGPYKTGSVSTCQRVENNLCDCGNLECVNGSPMNTRSCTCTCTQDFSLDKHCKLSCNYTDPFYCGTNDYIKANCYNNYAVSVTQKCPKMCQVCPYALQDGNGAKMTSQPVMSTTSLASFVLLLLYTCKYMN